MRSQNPEDQAGTGRGKRPKRVLELRKVRRAYGLREEKGASCSGQAIGEKTEADEPERHIRKSISGGPGY